MQLTDQSFMTAEQKIHSPQAVIVIGASTGGPTALTQIIPRLPKDFPASVIVVQHMRPGFVGLVAKNINGLSEIPVEEAEKRSHLVQGMVLFVPGESYAQVEKMQSMNYIIKSECIGNSVEGMRKRIDDTMISVAKHFGSRTIGVLLTGIGDDGREGMKEIRNQGGKTIVQDEASSIVYDMPRSAIDFGVVDEVLPIWSIADRIVELVGEF